jgi:hypothetical protein
VSGAVPREAVPAAVAPAVPVVTPPWALQPSTISDPATFRAHFPEFADTGIYSDAQVQANLDLGAALCGPRWGTMRQHGSELVCAHMLSLSRYAQLRAGGGSGAAAGAPGINTGLLTSKSVSKVSVGYDMSSVVMEGGGPWNYTAYGSQYLWLLSLVGIGGYETLGVANAPYAAGTVLTWARGVMIGWISS